MKTIRFGIIGGGLMGREMASAIGAWCRLEGGEPRPELAAICSPQSASRQWFMDRFASVCFATPDYRELLAHPEVDAVYCAVPHHLHEEVYCAAIESGKALLGEKPFGIHGAANRAILDCLARHQGALVRCSSEFPFFPAVQRIVALIESGELGTLIEVNAGFLHSSDLDPGKPLNWKRRLAFNGEYGVMGDLGPHVCHVPFRVGWIPRNVRAVLSRIYAQRPDGKGGMAPCETWDNATLLCEARDEWSGQSFPLSFKMQRIAPGEKNTWYLEIKATKGGARFSTKNPKLLETFSLEHGAQSWRQSDMGMETAFKLTSGAIFEFGFSDAVQQMLAAFVYELVHGHPLGKAAACVTPEETALSHRLFTAALASHRNTTTEQV